MQVSGTSISGAVNVWMLDHGLAKSRERYGKPARSSRVSFWAASFPAEPPKIDRLGRDATRRCWSRHVSGLIRLAGDAVVDCRGRGRRRRRPAIFATRVTEIGWILSQYVAMNSRRDWPRPPIFLQRLYRPAQVAGSLR